MTERTLTIGVIIVEDEKVLLVKHTEKAKHRTGAYGFPAGRVEEGETLIHAAARELEEETGFIVKEEDLIEFPDNYFESELNMKYGPEKFAFTVFLCKNYSGALKPSEENIPEWVPIADLDNYDTLPSIKQAVNLALKAN